MKLPRLTIYRSLWNELSRLVATTTLEFGGVVVGRHARGGVLHVMKHFQLSHREANEGEIQYDYDEVARVRKRIWGMYGPTLEPIGMWHNHPWPCRAREALEGAQITNNDISEMQVGDVELILTTYPLGADDNGVPGDDCALARTVDAGDERIRVRLEAWLKVRDKNTHKEKSEGEDNRVQACILRVHHGAEE